MKDDTELDKRAITFTGLPEREMKILAFILLNLSYDYNCAQTNLELRNLLDRIRAFVDLRGRERQTRSVIEQVSRALDWFESLAGAGRVRCSYTGDEITLYRE